MELQLKIQKTKLFSPQELCGFLDWYLFFFVFLNELQSRFSSHFMHISTKSSNVSVRWLLPFGKSETLSGLFDWKKKHNNSIFTVAIAAIHKEIQVFPLQWHQSLVVYFVLLNFVIGSGFVYIFGRCVFFFGEFLETQPILFFSFSHFNHCWPDRDADACARPRICMHGCAMLCARCNLIYANFIR